MRIKMKLLADMTLEQFADKHDLIMVVTERDLTKAIRGAGKFYAYFESAEIKNGGILSSSYGDGDTPEKAMAAYTKEISGKHLVVDAMQRCRRDIQVPKLT